MRNKIIFEFDSIDLNNARTFYNRVREITKQIIDDYLITRLQTRLDCNIGNKIIKNIIICSICNETFKRIYTPTKPNAILYQHDCKIYENIYQQKKIINIEVI